jgi:hypothetical protein
MQSNNITDKLNYIYETFNDHFENISPGFHNLLWQLLINNIYQDKIICLDCVFNDSKLELVLITKNEKGYTPLNIFFVKPNYKDGKAIIDNLNNLLFHLDKKETYSIFITAIK